MSTLAERHRCLTTTSEDVELRVALVYDGAHEPAALASILVSAGLPPNAGLMPLRRAHELAGQGAEAIVMAVDLSPPEGLATLRWLRRSDPNIPIVVTTRDAETTLARRALNAGADAFIPEEDAAYALGPAVRAVAAGLVCVPRVVRRLVAKPTFSHREREVLELLVAGLTNAEIADRLYLAESTVKSHVGSAFAKLGVRSRKDAAAILLDPAEGLSHIALARESALSGSGVS